MGFDVFYMMAYYSSVMIYEYDMGVHVRICALSY